MLKTRKKNTILVIFTVFIFSESLSAQENVNLHNMAYIGAGPTSNSNDENNDIPWSIGVMYGSIDTNLVWGIDIAGEGTLLDSTDGFNNDLSQGLSFNFLVGRDNSRTSDGRLAYGFVAGFITKEKECPSSYYIEYECYADQELDYEYGFNGGIFANYLISKKYSFGIRATTNSTQAIFGLRF